MVREFKESSPEQIPLNRAFLWILLSTLMISGSAFMGWLYYQHVKGKRLQDEQYRIVAIVQSCPQQEWLKTGYLAEWLDLSLDQPVNLYQFNIREGERKLLSCPLIKKAFIQKIRPGTLYISYEMRVPIAYLGDYSNTAIDIEGYLFPFRPFFTPKKLPILYLGLNGQEGRWGCCLAEHERLKVAFELLNDFQNQGNKDIFIKKIDVADAYADSDGKRQIVVALEETSIDHPPVNILLRLNTKCYPQNLANFVALRETFKQSAKNQWEKNHLSKPVIVDLRIPQLAFIKQEL